MFYSTMLKTLYGFFFAHFLHCAVVVQARSAIPVQLPWGSWKESKTKWADWLWMEWPESALMSLIDHPCFWFCCAMVKQKTVRRSFEEHVVRAPFEVDSPKRETRPSKVGPNVCWKLQSAKGRWSGSNGMTIGHAVKLMWIYDHPAEEVVVLAYTDSVRFFLSNFFGKLFKNLQANERTKRSAVDGKLRNYKQKYKKHNKKSFWKHWLNCMA